MIPYLLLSRFRDNQTRVRLPSVQFSPATPVREHWMEEQLRYSLVKQIEAYHVVSGYARPIFQTHILTRVLWRAGPAGAPSLTAMASYRIG